MHSKVHLPSFIHFIHFISFHSPSLAPSLLTSPTSLSTFYTIYFQHTPNSHAHTHPTSITTDRRGKFKSSHVCCVVCHYDFYLSYVACPTHPNRGVCIPHCEQLCKCPLNTRVLHVRQTSDDLRKFLKKSADSVAGLKPKVVSGVTFHPLSERMFSARRRNSNRSLLSAY